MISGSENSVVIMKKLVIFDMDGVLVDSEDGMADMTVRALEKWGISPSADEFRPFRGMAIAPTSAVFVRYTA